jgi:uncharacterized Ntn-hydrolase superfamily protein
VTQEKKKELAVTLEGIEIEIATRVIGALEQGKVTGGDTRIVADYILDTHEVLYGEYPEFEEANMRIEDLLKTPLTDELMAYKKREQELLKREQAAQKREQAAQARIAELERQLKIQKATEQPGF